MDGPLEYVKLLCAFTLKFNLGYFQLRDLLWDGSYFAAIKFFVFIIVADVLAREGQGLFSQG